MILDCVDSILVLCVGGISLVPRPHPLGTRLGCSEPGDAGVYDILMVTTGAVQSIDPYHYSALYYM